MCCLMVLVQASAMAEEVTWKAYHEPVYLRFALSVEKPGDVEFAKGVSKLLKNIRYTPVIISDNLVMGTYKGQYKLELQRRGRLVMFTTFTAGDDYNRKWLNGIEQKLHRRLKDEFSLVLDIATRIPLLSTVEVPSDEEFIVAAKRVFYKRGYKYHVVDGKTVEGVVHDQYRMQILKTDTEVVITWLGDWDDIQGNITRKGKVSEYKANLEWDIKYELAKYLL